MDSHPCASIAMPGSHCRAAGAEFKNCLPLEIRSATLSDRQRIAVLRYEVYARELGQYPVSDKQELTDNLDQFNVMMVVLRNGEISGLSA
jgi:hypothetical protein